MWKCPHINNVFQTIRYFAIYILKNERKLQKLCQEGKTYILLIVVVASDSANLQTRCVDYLIFRKSRIKLDDGYDVFAQSVVTTDKYGVISMQMTNLLVNRPIILKDDCFIILRYANEFQSFSSVSYSAINIFQRFFESMQTADYNLLNNLGENHCVDQ